MGNPYKNGNPSVMEPPSRDPQTAAATQGSMDFSSNSLPSKDSSVLTRMLHRPLVAAMILGLVSLSFLLAGIGRPVFMYYDEGVYVPEARAFVQGQLDADTKMHNLARPPFGKMLMAIGMKVAGDTSFGWRIASAVCGALTLVAVYLWTLLLLRDPGVALFAACLTLFNNFLFVMSRVGMMDAFLVFFLMWSLVAYTAAIGLDLGAGSRRFLLVCSGVLMGLAGACKWNAIDTLAVLVLVSFALLWVARRSLAGSIASLVPYARGIQQIGVPTLMLGFVVAPLISYSLTFWPLCRLLQQPFSLTELVAIHRYMWFLSTHWVTNKAITSAWYTWPLNTNPQRALSYLVANPVVAWGGLVAVIFCLRRFWKTWDLPEGLVVLLFAANYLQWAVTPEKGLMYYYYYPAVMILGVAIAVALRSLPRDVFGVRISLVLVVAAAAVFLWCYPRMMNLEAPWDCALGCWD